MRAKMVWLPCFASGAGTGLCLLYPAAGPAVFILPIPALMILLKQKDGRSALKLSAAFCLGMCMAAYAPALTIEPAVDTNLVIWLDLAIYIYPFVSFTGFSLPQLFGAGCDCLAQRLCDGCRWQYSGPWLNGYAA